MKSLKKTMVLIGCHYRWDVATKACLVEYIIENGIHMQEGSNKNRYEQFEEVYNVSWNSIFNWVKQYQYVYKTAKKAPEGTVIYSPLTVANGQEIHSLKTLHKLHKKLTKLKKEVEVALHTDVSPDTIRKTMKNLQEELSEASIKSE